MFILLGSNYFELGQNNKIMQHGPLIHLALQFAYKCGFLMRILYTLPSYSSNNRHDAHDKNKIIILYAYESSKIVGR